MIVGEASPAAPPPRIAGARRRRRPTIGRAGALLVDIAIDTAPRGYRIVARPGRWPAGLRACSPRTWTRLKKHGSWRAPGGDRVVKVQAPGPITLAAQLELSNGHRALTDSGAVRDLAASLAEGVSVHRAELARRLGATVVVQYDEPSLLVALEGRLSGVTSVEPRIRSTKTWQSSIDRRMRRGGGRRGHAACLRRRASMEGCCSAALSQRCQSIRGLADADVDGLGQFIDSGRVAVLGLVPATAPGQRPLVGADRGSRCLMTDRIGFSRAVLGDRIGISPACGPPARRISGRAVCSNLPSGRLTDRLSTRRRYSRLSAVDRRRARR